MKTWKNDKGGLKKKGKKRKSEKGEKGKRGKPKKGNRGKGKKRKREVWLLSALCFPLMLFAFPLFAPKPGGLRAARLNNKILHESKKSMIKLNLHTVIE